MKLTIKAFRGVNQPFSIDFDTRQNLTVLYGENGCGKTTISDAFEFVIDGTAGSLEEKSLDGKARLGQLVHAQCQKGDLQVALQLGDQIRSAKLAGTKVQHAGELNCHLRVLSRKNITKLIDETPSNRFARIQEFVSLPALDREEAALNELLLSEKRSFESQAKLVTQAEEMLEALFLQHADQTKFADQQEAWISEVLSESEATIAESFQILGDLNLEIGRLRGAFSSLGSTYAQVTTAAVLEKEETEALAQAVSAHSDDLAKAFETLQHAKEFLQDTEGGSCPVCDTAFEHETLVSSVNQKLAKLASINLQSQKTKKAKEAHQQAVTSQRTLQISFFEILTRIQACHQAAVDCELWALPDLIPAIRKPKSAEELTTEWFQELSESASQLKPLAETVAKEHESLQIRHELQKQIRGARQRIKETKEDGKRIEFNLTKGTQVRDVLREQRIRYANETLAAISDDFAHLYQAIHPGEEIENIRLYLHATQKGSAKFDGKLFGKKDASPVAYLSESHLDTLGLCLFLALQKRVEPEKTILFLDDAIASVDEAHMERLYQLILDEAVHFQHLIISSHYQPLRFKFRWGILTQSRVSFLELGAWSLERGLSLSKGPDSEITFLRKYVAEGEDASTIAAKSGIVLERLLDFLTGIYQCRLPRNAGAEQRWTLDHYKGGLLSEKKLFSALECKHFDDEGNEISIHQLQPLLEDIFNRLQVRNAIGCHYKELAGYFDEIGEALALGQATLALVDALCDGLDTLPDRKKDGCSWHNRGAMVTRRLYPLLKPE